MRLVYVNTKDMSQKDFKKWTAIRDELLLTYGVCGKPIPEKIIKECYKKHGLTYKPLRA